MAPGRFPGSRCWKKSGLIRMRHPRLNPQDRRLTAVLTYIAASGCPSSLMPGSAVTPKSLNLSILLVILFPIQLFSLEHVITRRWLATSLLTNPIGGSVAGRRPLLQYRQAPP